MRLWECNTCAGRFMDPQPDGSAYYHACPLLETEKPGVMILRPDAVDENLVIYRDHRSEGPKRPGRGRRELVDDELIDHFTNLGRPIPAPANPGLLTRAVTFIAAPFRGLFYG